MAQRNKMSSLESCVSAQIKNLIANLTNKKQYKTVATELTHLVSAFGVAAEKFMFTQLFAEIDFKDAGTVSGAKYQFKCQFLNQQLSNLSARAEFLDYFSLTFTQTDVDDFLEDLVKVLHLSLPVQLIVSLSFVQSSKADVVRAGATILRRKLRDYHQMGRPQTLPSYALYLILHHIKSNPDLQRSGDISGLKEWTQFLIDSNTFDFSNGDNVHFLPFYQYQVDTYNLTSVVKTDFMPLVRKSVSLAGLLEDLGPDCTSTAGTLQDVFGVLMTVGEKDMAEALSVVCDSLSGVSTPESRLSLSTFTAFKHGEVVQYEDEKKDKSIALGWREEVLSKVISDRTQLNWTLVVAGLDNPRFQIRTSEAFEFLARLCHRVTGAPLPLLPFTEVWKHKKGQVTFLSHAVHSKLPQDIFNFNDLHNKAVLADIAVQPEYVVHVQALCSLDIVKVLLQLSASEYYAQIRALFLQEVERFPDILLLSLSKLKIPQEPPLLEELLKLLLPRLVSPQTSPSVVLKSVWEANPNLVLRAAVEFYEREPNTITLSHLLELTQEIKDSLLVIAASNNHKFAVHFGLLASKRDFLHLQQWLQDRVKSGKSDFVKALLVYIQRSVIKACEGLTAPKDIEQVLERAQFARESLIIVFDNLMHPHVAEGLLSQELQSEVVLTQKQVVDLLPEINAAPPNTEEVEEAANRYFQQVYNGSMSIDDTIDLMKTLRHSSNNKDKEIFACMIRNLFDEYRFFHKYPEKELQITGELFGAIINSNLLLGITLAVAMKYVLESIKKPQSRLFRFGWYALAKFKPRLTEWPQYLRQIVSIVTLRQEQPQFVDWCEEQLRRVPAEEQVSMEAEEDHSSVSAAWDGSAPVFQPQVLVADAAPFSLPSFAVPSFERVEVIQPEAQLQDQIKFILNNTSISTIDEKGLELREILRSADRNVIWFATYLVSTRVPTEANFHELYLKLVIKLDLKLLWTLVNQETYTNIKRLLGSPRLLEDDRKPLKVFGSWLGLLTISRNRPIIVKDLDVKELLAKGYEQGHLIAVVPFVCKILEQCNASVVFTPRNPWISALLSLLCEIQALADLKTQISMEIEILFKNLRISSMQDFKKSQLLASVTVHNKANDFNVKEPAKPLPKPAISSTQIVDKVVVPKQLTEYFTEAEVRPKIATAVQNAIKEVLQPIVERSVGLALITTRELCLKDFALEKDSVKLKSASEWVVQSLAGSLAIVASREPFRTALRNLLTEAIFSNPTLEAKLVGSLVEQTMQENVNLGCQMIQKLVVQKALGDIEHDQVIQEAVSRRRNLGDRFTDENAELHRKQLMSLPETLRPIGEGLTEMQFKVYEDFAKILHPVRKLSNTISEAPRPEPADAQDQSGIRLLALFESQLLTGELMFDEGKGLDHPEVQEMLRQLVTMLIAQAVKPDIVTSCCHKLVRKMYLGDGRLGLYLKILEGLSTPIKAVARDVTAFISTQTEEQKRVHWPVLSALISSKLIIMPEFDSSLSKLLEKGLPAALSFATRLIQEFLLQRRLVDDKEIPASMAVLKRLTGPEYAVLQQLLTALYPEINPTQLDQDTLAARKAVEETFDEWLKFTINEPLISSPTAERFVHSLEAENLFSAEPHQIDFFFKTLIELAVAKSRYEQEIDYGPIDSFTKMTHFIVALARPEQKAKVLGRVLSCLKQTLQKAVLRQGKKFNQRPYFRILLNIMTDCSQPEDTFMDVKLVMELLVPIADTLHEINPCKVPAFCFPWLELTSHRFFMPKLLKSTQLPGDKSVYQPYRAKMKTLLVDLFSFIKLHYMRTPLSEALRDFYSGVLNVMMVIVRDFPEFLAEYHSDFCDSLPDHCVQLRNLVLAAAPTNIQLPDPVANPALKVDKLEQMEQLPEVQSGYLEVLGKVKEEVDRYLESRESSLLSSICVKMMTGLDGQENTPNPPLMQAVVLYVGTTLLKRSPTLDAVEPGIPLFEALILTLDSEGRRCMLNAIVNQLRYPNSHTHFFSVILLSLFESISSLFIQEQITRVLAERAIVHRPHPWGLVITFLELLKNPKYEFTKKPFVHSTPEIERLFDKMQAQLNQSLQSLASGM